MGWEDTVGSISSQGVGGLLSADYQNQSARAAANHAMSFEEYMSGTSYQRGMADMRAAGLNPILAYSHAGASTPGGVVGSGANPGIDPMVALSTAKQLQAKDKEMEKMNAEIATEAERQNLYRTQGAKTLAETDATTQGTAESRARTAKTTAEVPKVGDERAKLQSETAVNWQDLQKLISETISASARAWQDRQDVDRRKLYGPKSILSDTAETVDRAVQGVTARWKKWLGLSGESPKESAARMSNPGEEVGQ